MDAHERACNDCKLGIKAYQNLVGALNGFERLSGLYASGDHFLLSAMFCFSVVKYCKPFVETETPFGKKRYPFRQLKNSEGFSHEMHKHLLELRNTLVAHDDLESIEPRILQLCVSVHGAEMNIPISIAVSNKCLSYPNVAESIQSIIVHVEACVHGVMEKIQTDLKRVRDEVIRDPELAETGIRYNKKYGEQHIPKGGCELKKPSLMNNEWLNSDVPDFSHIHNGLVYEEFRVRRDFHGPDRIILPNGQILEIGSPQ